jgi:hypothetical protein
MTAADGQPRKKIGRPPKVNAHVNVRRQLGIIVNRVLKERIQKGADLNGTSMSQEAEHIILQGLAVIDLLDFVRKTLK